MTQSGLQFIEDLKNNNNKEWFHENKNRYENFKKEYQHLIHEILEKMKPLDASLSTLEVKNCTFRINRDIRFSKDKAPYKTNMSLWFSTNKKYKNSPGYYIHYEKGASFIAGGVYSPEPSELKKIRNEISYFHKDLEEIIANKTFKKEFSNLNRDEKSTLKNAPKGFDSNHPALEFLKLKSFVTTQKVPDSVFLDSNCSAILSQKLIVLKPLNEFFNRALDTED